MGDQDDAPQDDPPVAPADRVAELARQLDVDPDRLLDLMADHAEVLDDPPDPDDGASG